MTNEELLKVIEEAKANGATELDLSGNGLTELPAELFHLENLTKLHLGRNQLASIPSVVSQLRNLTALHLNLNQLTTLPAEICQLKKLEKLILWNNLLTFLPTELYSLPYLKKIYVAHNPLATPPYEIAIKGIEPVRQYLSSLQQEEQPLNEVKLILIGEGAAGKTSLTKRLISNKFDLLEPMGHGKHIADILNKNQA